MKNTILKQCAGGLLAVGLLLTQLTVPVAAATPNDRFAAVDKAMNYLAAQQAADGHIAGFGGESDWAAIGLAANGTSAAQFAHSGSALLDFLATDTPAAAAPATDIERRILAIEASGGDSTNFGGTDYASLLQGLGKDSQIGDPTLLNDDIFGILAIYATGDDALIPLAQDGLTYLLAHQQADGGFSYTTASCALYCGSDSNDTAAAIVALSAAEAMGLEPDGLQDSQTQAMAYLSSTRQSDGGFGYDTVSPSDGSSTAWALIALNTTLGPDASEATKAQDWLLGNQNTDGGFSFGAYGYTTSDTSTTAHALIALLGTNWVLDPTPIERPVTTPPTQPATNPSTPTQSPATSEHQTTATTQTAASTASDNGSDSDSDGTVLAAETTDGSSANDNQQTSSTGNATDHNKQSGQQELQPASDHTVWYIGAGGLAALCFGAAIFLSVRSRRKQTA